MDLQNGVIENYLSKGTELQDTRNALCVSSAPNLSAKLQDSLIAIGHSVDGWLLGKATALTDIHLGSNTHRLRIIFCHGGFPEQPS